jgi:hypothetical protein
MLQGVLIDEVSEVAFQRARDFGWSPRARAGDEPPRPLVRKILWVLYTGMQWKCLPVPPDAHGRPAMPGWEGTSTA